MSNQWIIGMLHNTQTDRYHPITFRYAPTPSGVDRYKSGGHHTDGFTIRSEALDFINNVMSKHYPGFTPCLEKDFHWDGEGIPAMVTYFSSVGADGNVTPLF
jgi:hypothetical protein